MDEQKREAVDPNMLKVADQVDTNPHDLGHKTTEFLVTIALIVIGTILAMRPGTEQLGAALIAAGGGTYTLSRGIAKKAACLLLLVALMGCGTPGMIRASEIKGIVDKITKRHDDYVATDPNYGIAVDGEEKRASALRSTALLRLAVDEAVKADNQTKASSDAVTERK